MVTIGLAFSFVGTLLMLPESFRLTRKNPQNGFAALEGMSYAPCLFIIGVIFLATGFIIQLIATL